MSKPLGNAPFTGRWTPFPVQGLLDLLKAKQYEAAVVWMVMLSDAQLHPQWRCSRTIASMHEETRLSPNTIQKAQRVLIDAGYAKIISGGGGSRKKITYAMTRIATFNGKPGHPEQNNTPPKKPVGDW